ncbi:MAG: putative Fe-S cluster assembly protein SufT [Motiliproteus sp.]
MEKTNPITLIRDCDALLIPSGQPVFLRKGTTVSIQQQLGGTYTVNTGSFLARIDSRDADALGLSSDQSLARAVGSDGVATIVENVPVDRDEIRQQLRSCYDPEIPVNILDLGLVYSCQILPNPGGGSHLQVQMTLTAPGCGMGTVLAADVKAKLERVRGVRSVAVKLVFDPPWNASLMSEAALLKLGLL